MRITIDIETIPTQDENAIKAIREGITPPGQYKKPESIAKWHETEGEAAFEDAYRRTALSGTTGEIACIGWAIEDEPAQSVQRDIKGDEAEILNQFFDLLKVETDKQRSRMHLWCGHHLTGFDLRFIWQRCVINNVRPKVRVPYNAKPWTEEIYDTLFEWSGDTKAGGSLDKISRAMGYQGKGDITGKNVWDYMKVGKVDEVAEYCRQDVELTRQLYARMLFKD